MIKRLTKKKFNWSSTEVIKSPLTSLGIFGDSFADPDVGDPDLELLAWPNLLRKHYDVTNYGVGGSSVWYSYNQFIQHHHRYKQVIFLETYGGRLQTSILETEDSNYVVTNINQLDEVREYIQHANLLTYEVERRLEAAKLWYIYLYNQQQDTELNRLMIEEVQRVRPDVILVSNDWISSMRLTMCHSFKDPNLETYYRQNLLTELAVVCHWPVEYNQVIADYMIQSLEQGQTILPPADQAVSLPHPWTHYWKKN